MYLFVPFKITSTYLNVPNFHYSDGFHFSYTISFMCGQKSGPKNPDDILSYLLFNWKKKSLLQLSKIFNIMLGNDFKQNIGNYYTIFLKFEIRHFFLLWILSRETQIVTNVHNESLNLLLNIFLSAACCHDNRAA